MTYKDFAHKLAEEIKRFPSETSVKNAVISILNAKDSNGNPLSDDAKRTIADYLIEEVGDYRPLIESYDNKEAVTMAQIINQTIARANAGKR